MRPYEFFFSYARADDDSYLRDFFSRLANDVAKLAGLGVIAPEVVGFFDTQSMDSGEDWEARIAQAVQTCKVFVPLYSRNYFNSLFCANEWQRFYERQDLYLAAHSEPRPPTLIPVPWIPTRWTPPYPPRVMKIQFSQKSAPPAYVDRGLWHMARLTSRYGDDYIALVEDLAQRIVNAGRDFQMPPLPDPPKFDRDPVAFKFDNALVAVPAVVPASGPRRAVFVIVAAQPSDLTGVRTQLDAYGNYGGLEWRPFKPPTDDAAAYVAAEVARDAGFMFPEVVPVGNDLLARLKQARDANVVVVLVVDRWSVRVADIRARMLEYDGLSFANVVVVVPWNRADQESLAARADLDRALREAFPNRLLLPDRRIFRDDVTSLADLRRVLADALEATVGRLRLLGPVQRAVDPTIKQPFLQVPTT